MTQSVFVKRLFLSLVLVAAIAGASAGARAQGVPSTVYDPWNYAENVAGVANQTAMIKNQINQYLQLVQQIQNQVQQIQRMQQMLHQLSPTNVNQVAYDLTQLEGLVNSEHQLILHEQNIDPEFKSVYHPYSPSANYSQLYAAWEQNTTLAAQDALHTAAAIVAPSESPDVTYSKNVANIMSAQGETDAIQAVGTVAAQQVEQLQKLQQLDAYRTSAEVQYYLQTTGRMSIDQQRDDALTTWVCAGAPHTCPLSTPSPSPAPG